MDQGVCTPLQSQWRKVLLNRTAFATMAAKPSIAHMPNRKMLAIAHSPQVYRKRWEIRKKTSVAKDLLRDCFIQAAPHQYLISWCLARRLLRRQRRT